MQAFAFMRLWLVIFFWAFAGGAHAQASLRDFAHELQVFTLPGPQAGTTRDVVVWRPAAAPAGELPTLYMADGPYGAYSALARLKPAIDSGVATPILVVGLGPHPTRRAQEYVHGWRSGAAEFDAHERWLIETIMPWAEREHGAARDRAHRAIGGFSHGADFAGAMAARHHDLFAGALLHSPLNFRRDDISAPVSGVRWVVTGGSQERGGAVGRAAARALEARGAPVRRCFGAWGHDMAVWRDLSAGAVLWLLALPPAPDALSPRERAACSGPG